MSLYMLKVQKKKGTFNGTTLHIRQHGRVLEGQAHPQDC